MENVDKESNVDKASNLVHEAIDKATTATYQVANKIVDKGDELYQVANKIVDKGDELNNLAHETIDKATTATHEAVDKLSEKRDQLMNAEQQLRKKYFTYIRDNPIASLGIAIGAGYLLSRLLNK
jgi:ElaB/YqjD/DUF883 family membrane-anchored ribosome-binding protein